MKLTDAELTLRRWTQQSLSIFSAAAERSLLLSHSCCCSASCTLIATTSFNSLQLWLLSLQFRMIKNTFVMNYKKPLQLISFIKVNHSKNWKKNVLAVVSRDVSRLSDPFKLHEIISQNVIFVFWGEWPLNFKISEILSARIQQYTESHSVWKYGNCPVKFTDTPVKPQRH